MSSTIHSENSMASQTSGGLILKCNKNQTKRLNHQNQSIGLKMLNTNGNHGYHGHHPAPTSVARRNERERNRVKMVNMGFATLRQHVPNGVKNKKMSKVETLRSAVEYIRELQKLLGTTSEMVAGGAASPSSTTSSLSSSSSPNSNIENQCYMFDEQYLHVPATSPDSNVNGVTDLENCYSSSMTPTPRTPDIADISVEATGLGSNNNTTTTNSSNNTSLMDHPQYSSPASLSLSGRLYSTSSYNEDNSSGNNDNHIDENNSPQLAKHPLITAYMNIKEDYQLHPQPNHNHNHHHHQHQHHQDHHVTHHQSLSSPTPSIVSTGMNGSSTIIITQLNQHQNAHHHQQQIDVRNNGSSGANGEDEMFDFVDWF